MKWKTLKTQSLFRQGLVDLEQQTCELPDGRIMPRYYVLKFPDWVNVVPVTKDKKIILIKQYRQASEEVHWEIPGGSSHLAEDPRAAAERELLEETGYASLQVIKMSEHYPNPALQNNKIHAFVALDCVWQQPQKLDEFEDVEVHILSLAEVERMLQLNQINHVIVVAALYKALAYIKNVEL